MLAYDFVSDAIADFRQAAALCRHELSDDDILIKLAPKPHDPPKLPAASMAVYAFFWGDRALKVGKVGVKSGPRFTYQHYHAGSAQSTLAASILANQAKVDQSGLDRVSVAEWIKAETDRVSLILPETHGIAVLSLLEAFLHVRWKPLFEGRAALG